MDYKKLYLFWIDRFYNWDYNKSVTIFRFLIDNHIIEDKDIYKYLIQSYFELFLFNELLSYYKKFKNKFWYQKEIEVIILILYVYLWWNNILFFHKNMDFLSEFILYSNFYRNIWNYKKSLNILKFWLKKYSNNSRLIYNLALLLNLIWDNKRAFFYAIKSYQIDNYIYSLDLIIRILLNNYLVSRKKLNKFFKKFDVNIDEHKNDLTCIWNIFYNLWKYDLSEKFYIDSIIKSKYDYYAYNWLWNLYFTIWNLERAKIFYKYSLIINNKNTYCYNWLWNIFLEEKNYLYSIKFFMKSLKINKNNFYALKKLGIIYFKLWDIWKSLFFLKKAFYIRKNDKMLNRYIKKINK